MNLTRLPDPPDPNVYGEVHAMQWRQAVYQWMCSIKAIIEADSTVNTQPLAPISVGTFTPTTSINGVDATSNFVATLVSKMQAAGITSPSSQRR